VWAEDYIIDYIYERLWAKDYIIDYVYERLWAKDYIIDHVYERLWAKDYIIDYVYERLWAKDYIIDYVYERLWAKDYIIDYVYERLWAKDYINRSKLTNKRCKLGHMLVYASICWCILTNASIVNLYLTSVFLLINFDRIMYSLSLVIETLVVMYHTSLLYYVAIV
jgi:hypothetical protein